MKTLKYLIIISLLLCPVRFLFAQDSAVNTAAMMAEEEEKFRISGFIDVQGIGHENDSGQAKNEQFHFNNQSLNIYMQFFPVQNLSVFTEIKYSNAPQGDFFSKNGESTFNSLDDGDPATSETTTTYSTNQYRDQLDNEYFWGVIHVERAYLEYALFPAVKIRAGKMLSPFGIWSQDHGAPAVTSIRVPRVVNSGYVNLGYPIYFTGAEVLGNIYLPGEIGFSYAVYVANSQTENSAVDDTQNSRAVGAFLNFTTPSIANMIDIDVGVSGYRGKRAIIDSTKYVASTNTTTTGYFCNQLDTIISGHLKVSVSSLPLDGTLILQGEYLYQIVDQPEEYTYSVLGFQSPADTDDHENFVWYAQVEYQLMGWITPYFRYEHLNQDNGNYESTIDEQIIYVAGLNIKPVQGLVLKGEFIRTIHNFPDYSGPFFFGKTEDYTTYMVSASVAF